MKNPNAAPTSPPKNTIAGMTFRLIPKHCRQAADGIRRIGIHLAVAVVPSAASGLEDLSGSGKFDHQSVRVDLLAGIIVPPRAHASPATAPAIPTSTASATCRANNKNATPNNPIEPK